MQYIKFSIPFFTYIVYRQQQASCQEHPAFTPCSIAPRKEQARGHEQQHGRLRVMKNEGPLASVDY
jgi:hypothetical protein